MRAKGTKNKIRGILSRSLKSYCPELSSPFLCRELLHLASTQQKRMHVSANSIQNPVSYFKKPIKNGFFTTMPDFVLKSLRVWLEFSSASMVGWQRRREDCDLYWRCKRHWLEWSLNHYLPQCTGAHLKPCCDAPSSLLLKLWRVSTLFFFLLTGRIHESCCGVSDISWMSMFPEMYPSCWI